MIMDTLNTLAQAEPYVPSTSSEASIKRAEAQNLDVVFPRSNELFIDLDTEAQFATFNARVGMFNTCFGIKSTLIKPSKSGLPRRHAVVELTDHYDVVTRIAMQAALGSDFRKEVISLQRVFRKDEHPILFFEKKQG